MRENSLTKKVSASSANSIPPIYSGIGLFGNNRPADKKVKRVLPKREQEDLNSNSGRQFENEINQIWKDVKITKVPNQKIPQNLHNLNDSVCAECRTGITYENSFVTDLKTIICKNCIFQNPHYDSAFFSQRSDPSRREFCKLNCCKEYKSNMRILKKGTLLVHACCKKSG